MAHEIGRIRRIINRQLVPSIGIWLIICVFAHPALGQENADCFNCHASKGLKVERDGREILLFVDPNQFSKSVHGDEDCVSCHQDLAEVESYPHQKRVQQVACSNCHDEDDGPIANYWQSTHGKLAKEGDPEAPLCQDCHGKHYILPLADRNSAISPFNIPSMCAQCHAEGGVERTHDIPQEKIIERYKQSIHGEGLFKQGLVFTAVCTSCHTGHRVLPAEDPASSIHKNNIVTTCTQCHGLIEQVHRKIIGGVLWEQEGVVPICVECHSPHEARKVFYDTNLSNADCLRCHGNPETVAGNDGRSLFVNDDEHRKSIHYRKGVSCAQCHSGVDPSLERSCSTITERVNCSMCHEAEVNDYTRGSHGQLHNAGDENTPYCTDCHGLHSIMEHQTDENASEVLKALVRESPTYSRNIPTLCARCHREGGKAAVRHLGEQTEIIKHYSMSIHGKGLLQSGLTVTATCTDCHSPHKELPHTDPESTISKENIAETCGKCHDGIYEQFQQSIHSTIGNPQYARLRGMPDLPQCNDCHSSHTIARSDMPEFKLGIIDQCGKCHEEVTRTFFDTYHGKTAALGDVTRAKCQDCHGAHDILPSEHPKSHLHRDNIVATCAACHKGSHRKFAGYLTHATHHDPDKYPVLFYTFWGMTGLLVGTFLFFGLHTLAWLPRSWKLRHHLREMAEADKSSKSQFVRFSPLHRKLHLMVVVSFFGLAITGMILKFSYSTWAQVLAKFLGGTEICGGIHRICAIITFAYFFLHLYDVTRGYLQKRGKVSLRDYLYGPDTILPKLSDVGDFIATLKWFLGVGPQPKYNKWTYWEKFDYFAVFWGVGMIGTTGLCLWFPVFFTRFLPGWAINVATIIHSDEALLATGFIFTIHFFNTHFRPGKFPMDTVIFTGLMPLEELKHERTPYYEKLVASGELDKQLTSPVPSSMTRLVKVFGCTALIVGLTLIALIIYAMIFVYR
ncbi:cytochrome c3 family protein [Planctomycetota bacterium]